ncbi:glycosyltransferase family 4 protein [Ruegeria faecimaris]|uniref:glycosyltransferase family 4 protein n=1 Tax=Ruegeria faecimaris TaxID=686389 RepID=UPI002491A571|nr:glycosyltransferase family 4 protein [Ruegeria faecimaris]
MRVLFVQAGFGPGGAEKVIAMVSGHFARRGCAVHVTGFQMPTDGPYFPMHLDVELSVAEKATGQASRITHIRSVIKKFRPDVVISFLTKVNVQTLLASVGTGIPVIISERNNPLRQDAHPLWAPLQGIAGIKAAKVVGLTHRGLADLPFTLRKKGMVIPNPILPFERVESSGTRRGVQLVAVGRLVRQKGFDMLLQAMQRIHSQAPDTRLIIYGEGSERENLQKLRDDLGLQSVARLPGNTIEVGEWAQRADILVATSRFEGFHNVVAEAAVSGIPVVSFDCDYGPSEFIQNGRNGYLVPVNDVSGLEQAVLKLIHEPDLRAQMSKVSPTLKADLSPDQVFAQWDTLIRDVTS